nr:MAG TPA: hypothetical protein [Caudoviricetes sp.]
MSYNFKCSHIFAFALKFNYSAKPHLIRSFHKDSYY